MPATKIILTVRNQLQLDEQIGELVSGLIATEDGLRKFVMAVERTVKTITSDDYPTRRASDGAAGTSRQVPPELLGDDHRGAAIYEGYRLGAEWMLKLLQSGELDIVIVKKD